MPTQADIANQQQLLAAHRRTLATLRTQQATFTSAYAPPAVSAGIAEARAEIRRCKAILAGWGVAVEDLPGDETPPASSPPADAPWAHPRRVHWLVALGGVVIIALAVALGISRAGTGNGAAGQPERTPGATAVPPDEAARRPTAAVATTPPSMEIAGSPTASQRTPPPPTACVYSGATIEAQLGWLIEAEARAANSENLDLIAAIFAPDAIIINGVNDEERSNTPLARYEPFFRAVTIIDAKHTAIRNLGINANVAYFTSASSGTVNGAPYDTPAGSDHWTFRKNTDGCWVIAEFDFNAAHLPFPPKS
jgi:hypothetical protein